jgi:hypothetical protein
MIMPHARAERRRAARLFAALLLFTTSPAVGRVQLPPPGADPQAIDFAADPLLGFLAATAPADDFRAAITAAVLRYPTRASNMKCESLGLN